MDKTNKKDKNNYNQDVIKDLQRLHGYTPHYIRMSIRGDRVGIMPQRIKKQYHQMANAAEKAKNEKLKQITKD